jgi:hypothetical protein
MGRGVVLVGLSLLAACATTGMRGRIVDCQTHSPVEGADVQLSSPSTGTSWEAVQTATDGTFAFDVTGPAKTAPLTVTAVKHGYQSAQKSFPSVPGAAPDVCMAPTLR